MKFENGQQMLDEIKGGTDLYNPVTCQYVFVYNDCGSIAVYGISGAYAYICQGSISSRPLRIIRDIALSGVPFVNQ